MSHKKSFSRQELRAVLQMAASENERATTEGDFAVEDVEEAARQAGIDHRRVRKAILRLERRRHLRSGLFLVGLGGAVVSTLLILLPQNDPQGWRRSAVLLHNEHRQLAFTFEVLLPIAREEHQPLCALPPGARVEALSYCVAQKVRLEPKQKVRLRVAQRPRQCPQIWVRVYEGEALKRSAIFTLPAAIEVDRRGRLDQKGIGRPSMSPAPRADPGKISSCPSDAREGA